MNPLLCDRLKELDVPDIHLPLHQKRLRAALLHAHRQGKRQEWPALSLFSPLSMLTSSKWLFLSAGLVVVALLVITGNQLSSSQAQAKDIVHNLIFHLNELSPTEREAVHNRMATDIASALQEAENAPDLRVVSVQDFEKEMRDMHESMKKLYPDIDFPSEPPMFQYALAQVLRYTDQSGKVVTIGIDKENIPVMKLVGLSHADEAQLEKGMIPADHLKLIP